MNLIGEYGLSLAIIGAVMAIMAALVAIRFKSDTALTAAKLAMVAVLSMFLLSSVALLTALVGCDFSINYVARYTERALPLGFRLAAFWAGQEGSLLLWAVLLAATGCIALFFLDCKQSIKYSATVIVTLAVVSGFFAALLLFADRANPFALAPERLADGNGLNPLLQDPGMIAHPPILFMGYALFGIPFAMMVGALISGQRDDRWILSARRWVLAAWLFLTIGIVLGAQWAYTTLGWGGYWGWDPVENASLLPWLTATALLHSLMVQRDRGMFRTWNAILLSTTFILCIFGTYLTRSGIVSSVHGFGQSQVGSFFFVFLMVVMVFCAALILLRLRLLSSDRPMEDLLGREGAFLATNIVLGGIMLVVLIGTLYPLISQLFGERITLDGRFYNSVACPAGMLMVALMAMAPLLAYGKQDLARLKKSLVLPAMIAVIAGIAAWSTGWRSGWSVVCAAIAAAGVTIIASSFLRAVLLRVREANENTVLAIATTFDANHRRYGAHIVHVGLMLMIVGITGSGVFSVKGTTDPLQAGEGCDVSGLHVRLLSLRPQRGENYDAMEAAVSVRDGQGHLLTLHPQRRIYDKWAEQPNSVVAIDSTWLRDVYLNLAGWQTDHNTGAALATLEVIVNPLVCWIWTGAWVLLSGTLVCMMPRPSTLFLPHRMESVATVSAESGTEKKARKRRPPFALINER